MNNIHTAIDHFLRKVDQSAIFTFFFQRVPATMFGLMRSCWAAVTLLYLLFQWKDITYFYSEAGISPHHIEMLYVRSQWRFTILNFVDQPLAVHCLYLILCIALFCMMIGLRARIATIVSVLLLFSFHERNGFILGGGDTLLRTIGFILLFTPNISGFSIDRARVGWTRWKEKRETMHTPTMPIWPWRLLLWQMIILYATSTWTKLLGTMWWKGTAIQAALHHPAFVHWPTWMIDPFMPIVPYVDYAALLFQFLWIFLLVPKAVTSLLPAPLQAIRLRRMLLIAGIFFHMSILLIMDAGSFSMAVFVAYIGLLREEDVVWMKKVMSNYSRNSPARPKFRNEGGKLETSHSIVVLYDGHCGLCLRSMYILHLCDWLHVLKPVDFRVVDDRRAFAPGITESKLDAAMHIRLANQTYLTGFDAFRHTTKALPPLCFLYPLLHIPSVAPIGRRIYKQIADNRKKCSHENCGF